MRHTYQQPRYVVRKWLSDTLGWTYLDLQHRGNLPRWCWTWDRSMATVFPSYYRAHAAKVAYLTSVASVAGNDTDTAPEHVEVWRL